MRSKIWWFTEICNSHYVSHFAAFFIVARTKISVVKSRNVNCKTPWIIKSLNANGSNWLNTITTHVWASFHYYSTYIIVYGYIECFVLGIPFVCINGIKYSRSKIYSGHLICQRIESASLTKQNSFCNPNFNQSKHCLSKTIVGQ